MKPESGTSELGPDLEPSQPDLRTTLQKVQKMKNEEEEKREEDPKP